MDRITMGFGPISDVTGFSHKAGMTYLEIQELLRRKINELISAYASLKSHVDSRNGDVISTFADTLDDFTSDHLDFFQSFTALGGQSAAVRLFGGDLALESMLFDISLAVFSAEATDSDHSGDSVSAFHHFY